MHPRLRVSLLCAAALLLVTATSAGAQAPFAACPQARGLECATVPVPLDHSGAVPGTVELAAVRRRAPTNPERSAVVALAGGPGQAAVPLAADFAGVLAPALRSRDLVVFDQRGTGSSDPLFCSGLHSARSLADGGRRCAEQLGRIRGLFTTADSVRDIEALRAAAGYEKLTLYGVSYGTKVAMAYAAAHPGRIEALVLDSVVPPDGPDPLQRSTFAAMGRALDELCARRECSAITGRPRGDLAVLVRRIRTRGSLRGRFVDSHGRRRRASLGRTGLLGILLAGDVNPTLRAELPGAVVSARRGDHSPLLRLGARSSGAALRGRQADGGVNDALFAATVCEELAFPWERGAGGRTRRAQARAATARLPATAFSPFDRSTALAYELLRLCLDWPPASPPPVPVGPLPDVPTLVLNGAFDLRTPLEDANRVRALIPGAQVVAVPFTGHSVLGSEASDEQCAQRALARFFAGAPAVACAATDNPFSPTPVAPTRLSRVRPTGPRGTAGRTVTAVLDTVDDLHRQVIGEVLQYGLVPPRVGALRGGRATVTTRGLTLRDAEYVPGVLVSGSAPDRGTMRLRIRGRSAARGSLTVSGRRITGRLGGRRIDVVAASSARAGAPEVSVREALRRFRLRHAG